MTGGLALLVAYDLKLFETLGRGFRTASQLAAALGIGERPSEALLSVAAPQGFVRSSKDGYTRGAFRAVRFGIEKLQAGFQRGVLAENAQEAAVL